jgi:hypothetical protein
MLPDTNLQKKTHSSVAFKQRSIVRQEEEEEEEE